MNELFNRISRLSPAQQALYDKMCKEKGIRLPIQGTIPRREDHESAPLSFAQERFWFIDQFESDKAVYNRPIAFRLTGLIEEALLERTLNEIVRRHEILRTTFVFAGEQPRQIIAPNLILTMSIVELMHLFETERETEALRLMKEELHQPFDLSQCPLVRPTLFRLGDKEYILFLAMHHIVFDGWSEGIFLKELATIYESFITRKPYSLPDLPVQYADFAQWQRKWMKGNVLESHMSYWKQRLDGAPPIFELPTDRARPPIKIYRGSKLTVLLTNKLSEGLKALSRREGSTLFMTLLAAFKILLHRYTGQFDIVIGTPLANRTKVEIEDLIGFFVNTLVLRTDLTDNPTFPELLGRIREMALEAYAHQDLPFEKLVEEVHPERSLSYSPLFQIMFNLENWPKKTFTLENVSIEEVEFSSVISYFDLELEIFDKEDGLRCSFIYNSALFNASTIERMIRHFQHLLESIVSNPGQHIETVPLLTEAERRQLLVEWNNTATDYPRDKCIHELFEEQVEQNPDAIAVVFEDQQMTYRELNTKANQLSHYLRKQGVGPEVMVGICVARSLEMVIGIFGILKAGGAYIPLDPAYPKERLSFAIADTQAPVLLTQQRLLEMLPAHDAVLICLDTDWNAVIAEESKENTVSGARADNLAYVIYTSGSTGNPKGVAIEHHSTVNLVHWARDIYSPSELSGVVASTSICFDISVFEFFATLCNGGTVILVENALQLPSLSAAQRVTLLYTVPSAIKELLNLKAIPPTVRVINLGGEPLPLGIVRQLYQLPGVEKVYDLYGPSETTTNSTCTLRRSDGPCTIGRPIANTQIYLLDAEMQPVPVGVTGELYIGGDGLARGYHKRAELTAERFIPNPFSEELGARIYKAGDLARYLPDGNIEFLGRIDHQVKIRGFRIELGEIEAVMGKHPAVKETLVLAREDKQGNKHLAAYIVRDQGSSISTSELPNFLRQKLPDYMIPSAFVMLDALPLTPNGKIDRKALPEPDTERPDLEDAYIAPSSPIEKVLAGIWCEVLGLNQVGVHDNFFELGGHSLLATQVISRLRNAFQVQIPLRSLFEYPTIAGLAIQIIQSQDEITDPEELALLLAELEGAAPGSFFRFKEIEDKTDE